MSEWMFFVPLLIVLWAAALMFVAFAINALRDPVAGPSRPAGAQVNAH